MQVQCTIYHDCKPDLFWYSPRTVLVTTGWKHGRLEILPLVGRHGRLEILPQASLHSTVVKQWQEIQPVIPPTSTVLGLYQHCPRTISVLS